MGGGHHVPRYLPCGARTGVPITPSMSHLHQPAHPRLTQYRPCCPHWEALRVHSWDSLGEMGVRERAVGEGVGCEDQGTCSQSREHGCQEVKAGFCPWASASAHTEPHCLPRGINTVLHPVRCAAGSIYCGEGRSHSVPTPPCFQHTNTLHRSILLRRAPEGGWRAQPSVGNAFPIEDASLWDCRPIDTGVLSWATSCPFF